MQRLSKLLIAVALLASATATWAQEARPLTPHRPNLLLQQRWLRLFILDGRLAVVTGQESQPPSITLRNVREHISINATASGTMLDYDLLSPSEKLAVHIQGDDQATIHHQTTTTAGAPSASPDAAPSAAAVAPQASETVVDYAQSSGQPIKLTITENGKTRVAEADTFWQLMLLEPELTAKYLVPILETLRPDWQLQSTVDELKQDLLKEAHASHSANRQHFADLVAKLADEQYTVRQRAERQLRTAGRAALPYLQSLRRSDLDAEQWLRVSEIIASYTDDREDTPERIATRLCDDRTAWLNLLSADQESARVIAADRLTALVGHPIDFDPAASPDKRSQQIAALRTKLLPKK